MTRPVLVAIVGGSGSGKSWLADKLAAELAPKAARLSLDEFYRDRSHLSMARRDRLNFDHPRAIDWPAVKLALQQLSDGRAARIPCYDFATHCRLKRERIIKPKPVVVVDGLWLLRSRAVRAFFDFSIFLDCSARMRLARRLKRDLYARGRSEASVRRQFHETVEPMNARYVAPQATFANVVLRGQCTSTQVRRLAVRLKEGSRAFMSLEAP